MVEVEGNGEISAEIIVCDLDVVDVNVDGGLEGELEEEKEGEEEDLYCVSSNVCDLSVLCELYLLFLLVDFDGLSLLLSSPTALNNTSIYML